ncbi:MAG: LLM class oxidoreductase [Bacteroidota bacterium]
MSAFQQINRGFNSTFQANELSLGVVIPIENYNPGSSPNMKDHIDRIKLIDRLGFKALWVRDIPFNVPSFGDVGQMFDPFTYLGFIAGKTEQIALGVSSIALPLHHPLNVAKAATSIDQLSDGRMILGVASGDRPQEYPGMNVHYENRGELFRQAFEYIRAVQDPFPSFESSHYGNLNGQIDMLPKPVGSKIPMMMTGSSRQSLEWNAKNADGWMNYPKNLFQQKYTIDEYRSVVSQLTDGEKPFMHPLYLDLHNDDNFRPEPIHLGFRIGVNPLVEYLHQSKEIGVNHIALNLRFNQLDLVETLQKLADEVLPHFHKKSETN